MTLMEAAPSPVSMGVLELPYGDPISITVAGTVALGARRRQSMGFPTANLVMADENEPRDGVYAAWFRISNCDRVPAVVFVGRRAPSPLRDLRLLEAHLIGYSGNLYGERAVVELVRYVRVQRPCSDGRFLRDQLGLDVAAASASLVDATQGLAAPCGCDCSPPALGAPIIHTTVAEDPVGQVILAVSSRGIVPPPGRYLAKVRLGHVWHAAMVDITSAAGDLNGMALLRIRGRGCLHRLAVWRGAVDVAFE